MARITTEDCIGENKCPNPFSLVVLAAKRARHLSNGLANPKVDVNEAGHNEKPTVVALREIAAGLMNEEVFEAEQQRIDELEDANHYSYNRYAEMDNDNAIGRELPGTLP